MKRSRIATKTVPLEQKKVKNYYERFCFDDVTIEELDAFKEGNCPTNMVKILSGLWELSRFGEQLATKSTSWISALWNFSLPKTTKKFAIGYANLELKLAKEVEQNIYHKVCIYCYPCYRGMQERPILLRILTFFKIQFIAPLRMLYSEFGSKNNQGGLGSLNQSNKTVRQYASDSEWCHVRILDKYFNSLPHNAAANDTFYLQPLCNTLTNASAPWFKVYQLEKIHWVKWWRICVKKLEFLVGILTIV